MKFRNNVCKFILALAILVITFNVTAFAATSKNIQSESRKICRMASYDPGNNGPVMP